MSSSFVFQNSERAWLVQMCWRGIVDMLALQNLKVKPSTGNSLGSKMVSEDPSNDCN